MTKTKQPNWQSESMIPVFVEISQGMLEAAEDQLTNLEQVKGRAHVLDENTVKRIIKLTSEQNENNLMFLEQCKRWMSSDLNERQIKMVKEIEHNSRVLADVNPQILFLAKHFKNRTIDKILEKDDLELILALASGEIDLPV